MYLHICVYNANKNKFALLCVKVVMVSWWYIISATIVESALPINLSAMEGCLIIKVLSNFEINIPNNNSKDMAIPNRLSSAKYQNESTA